MGEPFSIQLSFGAETQSSRRAPGGKEEKILPSHKLFFFLFAINIEGALHAATHCTGVRTRVVWTMTEREKSLTKSTFLFRRIYLVLFFILALLCFHTRPGCTPQPRTSYKNRPSFSTPHPHLTDTPAATLLLINTAAAPPPAIDTPVAPPPAAPSAPAPPAVALLPGRLPTCAGSFQLLRRLPLFPDCREIQVGVAICRRFCATGSLPGCSPKAAPPKDKA